MFDTINAILHGLPTFFGLIALPDSTLLGVAVAAGASMPRILGSLHYVTAVIVAFVPLAASLYLTITVAWTLAQRVLLRRRYPLA